MILHRLKLKGSSVAFRDRAIEIDFDALGPGIVCIVGDNGAGKTTLLEASGPGVLYRLFPSYGESFADHVAPGVRDASAELTFSIGGIIHRALVQADPLFNGGRGKSEAYLFANGTPVAGPSVKAFDAAIGHVVPPLPLYLASAFASQGGGGSLISLPKAAKKDLFVGMLGVDHLQVDAEVARTRGQSVLAALETLRSQINDVEGSARRAAELESAIAGVRDRHRAASDEVVRQAAAVAGAAEQHDARRSALEAGRATAERRGALERAIAAADTAISELTGRIEALDDLVSLEPDVEGAVARIAELDAAIAERRSREAAQTESLTSIAAALSRAQTEREGLLAAFQRLSRELNEARQGAAGAGDDAAVRADVETRREKLTMLADQIQSTENALSGTEADANTEAQAKSRRELLLARRAALAPRQRLLGDLEAPESDICQRCPLTQDARLTGRDVTAIDEELAALPEINGTPAADTHRALQARIRGLQLERQDEEQALRHAEDVLRTLEQARVHAERVAILEGEIAANRETGLAKRAEIDNLEIQRVGAESERASVRTELEDLERERVERAKTAALAPQVASARTGKEAAERELQAARDADDAATRELATLPPADLDALTRDADRAAGELAAARESEQRAVAAARAAEIELARLEGERNALGDPAAEIEALRARERELSQDAADWSLLERSLGREGVQALLIDAAGPAVTQIVNDLLNSCYGPRFSLSIETTATKRDGGQKEVFEIRIIDAEAGREARQGSGGEMVIIDLALRLGLSIYNAITCGFELRTLWLDEMTGALSPDNADRFVQMLRRAIEIGGFHQVLMISHLPSVWEQADARLFVAGGNVTTDLQEAA